MPTVRRASVGLRSGVLTLRVAWLTGNWNAYR
jgi:hypothetical protein